MQKILLTLGLMCSLGIAQAASFSNDKAAHKGTTQYVRVEIEGRTCKDERDCDLDIRLYNPANAASHRAFVMNKAVTTPEDEIWAMTISSSSGSPATLIRNTADVYACNIRVNDDTGITIAGCEEPAEGAR